jgi:hypothetical protein
MLALESPSSRMLLRVGLLLWLAASLGAVWEILALQPPDSPFHAGVLAGPIAQLYATSFALGTAHIVLGLGWPSIYDSGKGAAVAWLLVIGSVVHLAALFYAASRGLMAVQILDPRSDAKLALYGRGLGHVMTIGAGIAITLRALRR